MGICPTARADIDAPTSCTSRVPVDRMQIPCLLMMVMAAGPVGADPMKFTVYSDPVELRYGEVHNRNRFNNATSQFPKDVVERYADGRRLMAISGFDVDMVRLNADGSESPVLLS